VDAQEGSCCAGTLREVVVHRIGIVVGPIIAHVSVNNNLPFENKGNPHDMSLLGARGGVGDFFPEHREIKTSKVISQVLSR
jgi:hypothetical protein